MANAYTGDVDVVVEFSLSAINRFLALQHQGGGQTETYLHSLAARIDDANAGVQGIATVQVSPPTITLPANEDDSSVTVHFQVMARKTPVTESLPQSIHGELQVTVRILQEPSIVDDANNIVVDLPAEDLRVSFTPDAGAPLPNAERDLVAEVIRNFLRTGFQPVMAPVSLPEGEEGLSIRHWRINGLRSDDSTAVALLLNLRDVEITDEHIATVRSLFLDGHDFAVAIGRDFLVATLTDLARTALRQIGGIRVHDLVPLIDLFSATVSPDLDGITVDLVDDAIRLTVPCDARGSVPAVGDFSTTVTARQDFILALDDEATRISLQPAGEPDVELPRVPALVEGIVRGFLMSEITAARDRILDELPPLVEGLPPGFSDILLGLRIPPPDVTYAQPQIGPEGVIFRGSTYAKRWKPVVASFEVRRLPVVEGLDPEFGRVRLVRHELNAFQSWIPGGTVQRYRWTDGMNAGDRIWATEEHRFFTTIQENVLDDLAVGRDPGQAFQLCLEVSGVQGHPPLPASGWTCTVVGPQVPAIRGLAGGLMIDVVGAAGDVVAHIDPWAGEGLQNTIGRTPRIHGGTSMLVLFLESEFDAVWKEVRNALDARARKGSGVFVVAIAPSDVPLSPLRLDGNIGWARTDDPNAAWTNTFNPSHRPAAFLVNSFSKVVWQQAGRVDRSSLTAALDEHLVARRPLRWRQLQLSAKGGQPAPDFLFEYGKGRRMALRTLRRRPVILSFWKTWSAPCLAQLRELQALRDHLGRNTPAILAINDGEDPSLARELLERKRLGLTFVADQDRQVSRAYAVNCWPTTVSLDENGIVQQIQFGLHAHEAAARRHQPSIGSQGS